MPFVKIDDLSGYGIPCRCPEHDPPMYIVLPKGRYKYICPECGKEQIIDVIRPDYSTCA